MAIDGLTGVIPGKEVPIWEVNHSLASRADETRDKSWWRREDSEYPRALKTRNLLIFRNSKNAEHGKIASNWNVSGTRIFIVTVRQNLIGQD
jgi:hypothetical protein